MIFNEKEIADLGREKRVIFPASPEKEKKQEAGDINSLVPVFSYIVSALKDVKNAVSKIMGGFNSIDEKMEVVIKAVNKNPEPEPKKSDKWDFKIIRNMDNQIQKIEATRKE